MSLFASIRKNSLRLLIFAVVTAAVLAGTYEGTKDTIAESQRRAAEKALLEIIPASRIDNDLLLDTIPVPAAAEERLGLPAGEEIHLAKRQGEIIAVIIPAIAPDGYSGAIRFIAGVNRDGSVAGIRVLSHKETPGLGDKVDLRKSNWILGFNGKSLSAPEAAKWKVKKDGGEFDQFTGATVTPRAMVKQIKQVLAFVAAEQALLFNEPPPGAE